LVARGDASIETAGTVEELVGSMVGPAVRASALLRRHLSHEQRVSFVARGYFELVSEWGRRYRIVEGNCRNVYSLVGAEDGSWHQLQCFCLMAPGVPMGDLLLTQKLLLETDERSFLERAIVAPVLGPPHAPPTTHGSTVVATFRMERA
jgi:hypothetical protein